MNQPTECAVNRSRSWIGTAFLALLGLIVALSLARLVIGSGNWQTLFWITLGYLAYELLLNLYLAVNALVGFLRQPAEEPAAPAPGITVVIAAHNEENTILPTLELALAQQDILAEIIIVSNGSTDRTVPQILDRWLFAQDSTNPPAWSAEIGGKRITLIDLPSRGKAAALNRALHLSQQPVFITLDADTHLKPGALAALSRAFLDEKMIAAGGFLHIRNPESGGWLARFQFVEYVKNLVWRVGFAASGICLQVSGAFGGFRRDALLEVGGFDERSLVEDYEIIYRMHEKWRFSGQPYRIGCVPGAVAETEAPHTVGQFIRQRTRWFCGFLQTLWQYRRLIFEPRCGAVGWWMLPVKCVDAILPVWGISALLVFLFVATFGHETIQPLAVWMFLGKYTLEFLLSLGVVALHRRLMRRSQPASPRRFWVFGCLLFDGIVFNWFRQLAVLRAYVEFLLRARRWEPSLRKAESIVDS